LIQGCLDPISNCSERFLDFDKFLDSINHILDEILLGSSQSSSVGNVKDSVISFGVLTMDTSDLDVVLGGNGLELLLLLHKLWKLDVDGGSEGGSEIGWARGDVTKMLIMGELAHGLDDFGSSAESIEDSEDIGSWLHRDDSELILFVDPDEESLGVVVEDTSAGWPVSIEVARLQESVSLPINN
jgi:hypothetical protein